MGVRVGAAHFLTTPKQASPLGGGDGFEEGEGGGGVVCQ